MNKIKFCIYFFLIFMNIISPKNKNQEKEITYLFHECIKKIELDITNNRYRRNCKCVDLENYLNKINYFKNNNNNNNNNNFKNEFEKIFFLKMWYEKKLNYLNRMNTINTILFFFDSGKSRLLREYNITKEKEILTKKYNDILDNFLLKLIKKLE